MTNQHKANHMAKGSQLTTVEQLAELIRTENMKTRRPMPIGQTTIKAKRGEPQLRAAVLDAVATGPDVTAAEVVELSMFLVEYGPLSGRVSRIVDDYYGLQQPSQPLSEEVRHLTGIDDGELVGRCFDIDKIVQLLAASDIVIVFNAAFSRRVLERTVPEAPLRPWAGVSDSIDWSALGASGDDLGGVLATFGYYYDHYGATANASAIVSVLWRTLPQSDVTVLAALLEFARRPSAAVIAIGAPADRREVLEQLGYAWNPGRLRAWWREIQIVDMEDELVGLERSVYKSAPRRALAAMITATERYRPLDSLADRVEPIAAFLRRWKGRSA